MSDDVKAKLARANAELQALADEHVDASQGMGQFTALNDLDAIREAGWELYLLKQILATDPGDENFDAVVEVDWAAGPAQAWYGDEPPAAT